jgi:hypothetical protein
MMHRSARLVAVLLLLPTVLVALVRPAAADAPRFTCGSHEGGATGVLGHVTGIRTARHAGYDRFVVQFRERRVPAFEVSRQRTSRFVLDPSGRVVRLLGHAGIRVRFDHATGVGTYHGPRRFVPRFPQLREARETGDFEAVYQWGLGVHRNSCMRVFSLRAPARLVIDTRH